MQKERENERWRGNAENMKLGDGENNEKGIKRREETSTGEGIKGGGIVRRKEMAREK